MSKILKILNNFLKKYIKNYYGIYGNFYEILRNFFSKFPQEINFKKNIILYLIYNYFSEFFDLHIQFTNFLNKFL